MPNATVHLMAPTSQEDEKLPILVQGFSHQSYELSNPGAYSDGERLEKRGCSAGHSLLKVATELLPSSSVILRGATRIFRPGPITAAATALAGRFTDPPKLPLMTDLFLPFPFCRGNGFRLG